MKSMEDMLGEIKREAETEEEKEAVEEAMTILAYLGGC